MILVEGRSISPFIFELNETSVDPQLQFYVENGKPNLVVNQGEAASFPITIISATSEPTPVDWHVTIGNEQVGPIKLPPGVNIKLEPDHMLLKPNENQIILITVIAAEKAPSNIYDVQLVGVWPEFNGFSGTSFSLHIGKDYSYSPNIEIIPNRPIQYGEIFTIHAWLASYENKPEKLRYLIDVIDNFGKQVDSTLWFAREDFVYEFDTTHPAYNITEGGIYYIQVERADTIERTGIIEKTMGFYLDKPTQEKTSDELSNFMDMPPLKQFKNGVQNKEIVCKNELTFVIKKSNNLPSCVKPSSISRLVSIGWAKTYSESNNAFVQPSVPEKVVALCSSQNEFINGGYYIAKPDDSIQVVYSKSISNGWETLFMFFGEIDSKFVFVYVYCE